MYANFYLACVNGDIIYVKDNLNVQNIDDIFDGLMAACRYERIEIIKELLKVPEIDINKKNKYGICSLNEACWYKNIDAIKLLLTYNNIDINNIDNYGSTSLMTACCRPETEAIINTLLEHPDINIYIINKYGETALSYYRIYHFNDDKFIDVQKKFKERILKDFKFLQALLSHDIVRYIFEKYL